MPALLLRREPRPKMIKKLISITPQQNDYLDAAALSLGTSISDLVRRAIDDWRLSRPISPTPEPKQERPRARRKPRA